MASINKNLSVLLKLVKINVKFFFKYMEKYFDAIINNLSM